MPLNLGNALLILKVDTNEFKNSLRKAVNDTNTALGSTSTGLRKAVKSSKEKLDTFTRGLEKAGAAAAALAVGIGIAFSKGIRTGARFEQAMSGVAAALDEVRGNSDDAQKSFEKLTTEALRLGATTTFTASQAAEGMRFLALAGFETSEIIASIEPVLRLAEAGMLNLGRAAEIVSNNVNAFKLEATDAARVADVLAVTAANADTTIDGLGESFKFAAPVAAALGQSIEDTAATLGVLANAGLKNTISGTALAQILGKLAKEADKADEILKKYGSSFAAVDPEVNSIIDIVEEFNRVNVSAGDVLRLFEARAGRAFLSLRSQGSEAIEELRDKIDVGFGESIDQAITRMDNFAGAVRILKSVIEASLIRIFDSFKEQIREAVQGLTDFIAKFEEFAQTDAGKVIIQRAAAIIAVIGAAAAAFAGLALALAPILSVISSILGIMAKAGVEATIFSGLLSVILANLAPIALAVAAIATAAVALFTAFEGASKEISGFLKAAGELLKTIVGIIWEVISTVGTLLGKLLTPLFKVVALIATIVAKIITFVLKAIVGIVGWFGKLVSKIVELALKIPFVAAHFKLLMWIVENVIEGLTKIVELLDKVTEATFGGNFSAEENKEFADSRKVLKGTSSGVLSEEAGKRQSQMRQYLELMGKLTSGQELTILQLEKLKELRESTEGLENVKAEMEEWQKLSETIKTLKERRDELSDSEKKQLTRLEDRKRAFEKNVLEPYDLLLKNGLVPSGKELDKIIAREMRLASLQKEVTKLSEDYADAMEEVAKAQKNLDEELLSEKEKIGRKEQERIDMLQKAIDLTNEFAAVEAAKNKEDIAKQKEKTKELEEFQKFRKKKFEEIMNAEGEGPSDQAQKRFDQKTLILNKQIEASKKRTNELTEAGKVQQDQLNQSLVETAETQQKAEQAYEMAVAKHREDTLGAIRDIEIARLKSDEKWQKAAALQAQKILDDAEEFIKKRGDLEEAEIKRIREIATKNATDVLDEGRKKERQEAAKRRQFLKKERADLLKDEKRYVEAAKIENELLQEKERERFDELKLEGKERLEAEQLLARKLQKNINEAIEKEKKLKKEKDKTKEVADKAVDNIVKEIRTVDQLLRLRAALFRIKFLEDKFEERRQKRLIESAKQEQRTLERMLALRAKLASQFAEEKDPAAKSKIMQQIQRNETNIGFQQQAVTQAASRAGVAPADAASPAGIPPILIEPLVEAAAAGANRIIAIFGSLPTLAVDELIRGLVQNLPRAIQAFKDFFGAIAFSIDPEQGKGGRGAGGGQPVAGFGAGADGGVNTASADNRKVDITVNNNIDANTLERHLVNFLEKSEMMS